jgi:hypothetical protein
VDCGREGMLDRVAEQSAQLRLGVDLHSCLGAS